MFESLRSVVCASDGVVAFLMFSRTDEFGGSSVRLSHPATIITKIMAINLHAVTAFINPIFTHTLWSVSKRRE